MSTSVIGDLRRIKIKAWAQNKPGTACFKCAPLTDVSSTVGRNSVPIPSTSKGLLFCPEPTRTEPSGSTATICSMNMKINLQTRSNFTPEGVSCLGVRALFPQLSSNTSECSTCSNSCHKHVHFTWKASRSYFIYFYLRHLIFFLGNGWKKKM